MLTGPNRAPLFSSPEALRHAFETGLSNLLTQYDELGTFILVLANAASEQHLWGALREPLRTRFSRFAYSMDAGAPAGLVLDDAQDDLQVFRKLLALGFEKLSATEYRQAGCWELQYNPMRSLRPARLTDLPAPGISIPFNGDDFNFNKPFLRKEILWQGSLAGRHVALFYNKYPFIELHGLLVPQPRRELPQLLAQQDNEYLWRLTGELSGGVPGIGFGYNSYGACASINHLHFQMFHRERPLPVADSRWRHNGGAEEYPVSCHGFHSAAEAWDCISGLHDSGTSYNLIYLPDRVYCLPRKKQGSYDHAKWAIGFAWYELAGGFSLFSREDFERLDQGDLESELSRLSLPA